MTLFTTLLNLITEKILIIDGGMGTMIQSYNLDSDDYGGHQYDGCNDILNLTRPDIIKKIHIRYLKAGADIIETNTFNANAISLKDYDLDQKVEEINFQAAQIAKECCSNYENKYVAGSIGPSSKSLILSENLTFMDVEKAYFAQVMGLIKGGCDLLFVETVQDTLNLKAVCQAIKKAQIKLNQVLPLFISVSILKSGTMLGGQEIESFYTSIRYLNPFAVGLNCATGPREMKKPLSILSEISDLPVFIYPNAGIPNEFGQYTESPVDFGLQILEFIEKGWVNLIGGCCGTTAAYIKQLSKVAENKKSRKIFQKSPIFSVSGAIEINSSKNIKPILVGERTNVQGSSKFKELIISNNYDKALEVAKHQIETGAQIIDVCLLDTSINEVDAIKAFYPKLTRIIKNPIMIDSINIIAIEKALEYCQGKSIINSINLEGGIPKLVDYISLMKKYGAAVVVGVIDEEVMAIDFEHKISVAKRLYHILVNEYRINPSDIIFDMLVFAISSGQTDIIRNSAKSTLKAVKEIKSLFPDSSTILGISNVSYGLSKNSREVFNSVFLHHAIKMGLDLAIVNPNTIKRYTSISDEEKSLVEDVIFNRDQYSLKKLIIHFQDIIPEKKSYRMISTPEEAVRNSIINGIGADLQKNLQILLKSESAEKILNRILMKVMEEVGSAFSNGELLIPEVLESAEVMQSAIGILEPFFKQREGNSKKRIILATVKGDVHDIGKHIVRVILASNGFEIIDLGVNVDNSVIITAIKEHKPDLIGLSGLLVKSAQNMVVLAEELAYENVSIPIIIGGAALTESYVSTNIQPVYKGFVYYAEDAMVGLKIVKAIFDNKLECI